MFKPDVVVKCLEVTVKLLTAVVRVIAAARVPAPLHRRRLRRLRRSSEETLPRADRDEQSQTQTRC